MPVIYVDADGCPVKEEVYKVAGRHKFKVIIVANKPLHTPMNPLIEMQVVAGGFDVADDWIVENIKPNDICITVDIPLADRCLKKHAKVLGHKGNEFTPDSIGDILATRELMARLREMGEVRGGPAPMDKKARSQFLSKLDQVIHACLREQK